MPLHVEPWIRQLEIAIVVADGGVERDALIEQRTIRRFELGLEIVRAIGGIDVVTEHDHEIEWKLLPPGRHLLRDLVLRLIATPRVANDREANRAGLQRQRELAIRR